MRALQFAGMSQRTQQGYTRSVRMLVDFYNKAPDKSPSVQLQDNFLHRKNNDKWSTGHYAYLLQWHQILFYQCAQTTMAHSGTDTGKKRTATAYCTEPQ